MFQYMGNKQKNQPLVQVQRKLVKKSTPGTSGSQNVVKIEKNDTYNNDQQSKKQHYDFIFDDLRMVNMHTEDVSQKLINMCFYAKFNNFLKKKTGLTLQAKGNVFCLYGESGTGKTFVVEKFKNQIENNCGTMFHFQIIYFVDFCDWKKENHSSMKNKTEEFIFVKYIKQLFLTNNICHHNNQSKIIIFEDVNYWFDETNKFSDVLKIDLLEKIIGVGNCLVLTFCNFNSFFLFDLDEKTASKKLKDLDVFHNKFTTEQLKLFVHFEGDCFHFSKDSMVHIFKEAGKKWNSERGFSIDYSTIHNKKIQLNFDKFEEWHSTVYSKFGTVVPGVSKMDFEKALMLNWKSCKPNLQKFKSRMIETICYFNQCNKINIPPEINNFLSILPSNQCNSMIERMAICFNCNGIINKHMDTMSNREAIQLRLKRMINHFVCDKSMQRLLDSVFKYYIHHQKFSEKMSNQKSSIMFNAVSNYLDNIGFFDIYTKKMWLHKRDREFVKNTNTMFSKIQTVFNQDIQPLYTKNNSINMQKTEHPLFSNKKKQQKKQAKGTKTHFDHCKDRSMLVYQSGMGRKTRYEMQSMLKYIEK